MQLRRLADVGIVERTPVRHGRGRDVLEVAAPDPLGPLTETVAWLLALRAECVLDVGQLIGGLAEEQLHGGVAD